MNNNDLQVDVAIIGAGTAGTNALKEIRHAGKSFVLIDHGRLGKTCARVGCMPFKAALHVGAAWQAYASHRLAGNEENTSLTPTSLWQAARRTRDTLAANAADRTIAAAGDHLIMGTARFVSPDTVEIDEQRVKEKAFVIATGSHPVMPRFFSNVEDRVLTTDTLGNKNALPRSVGILDLGAIGLALSRLGVRVVAGDIKEVPASLGDPETAARAFCVRKTIWSGSMRIDGAENYLAQGYLRLAASTLRISLHGPSSARRPQKGYWKCRFITRRSKKWCSPPCPTSSGSGVWRKPDRRACSFLPPRAKQTNELSTRKFTMVQNVEANGNTLRVLIHAPTAEAVTRARNNAANLLAAAPDAEVRLLANAGGVAAVLDAPHQEADRVTFVCENTLKKIQRTASSPLQTVPVSILAIARMQQEGWLYVRA